MSSNGKLRNGWIVISPVSLLMVLIRGLIGSAVGTPIRRDEGESASAFTARIRVAIDELAPHEDVPTTASMESTA